MLPLPLTVEFLNNSLLYFFPFWSFGMNTFASCDSPSPLLSLPVSLSVWHHRCVYIASRWILPWQGASVPLSPLAYAYHWPPKWTRNNFLFTLSLLICPTISSWLHPLFMSSPPSHTCLYAHNHTLLHLNIVLLASVFRCVPVRIAPRLNRHSSRSTLSENKYK